MLHMLHFFFLLFLPVPWSLTADHDEKLHEMVVDAGRGGTLDDEDVLITNGSVDLDRGLQGGELGDLARRERYTKAGLQCDG
jgi:hypothetical protein